MVSHRAGRTGIHNKEDDCHPEAKDRQPQKQPSLKMLMLGCWLPKLGGIHLCNCIDVT